MNNEKKLKKELDSLEEQRKRYLLEEDYKRYWGKKASEPKFFYGTKKMYVPSIEELNKLEEYGINAYGYLIAKAGEALILDGINHPHKGILKNSYKYLREDPILMAMVCSMYPIESIYSETGRYDNSCLQKIINKSADNSIYRFDNLGFFDCSNGYSQELVIKALASELENNPEYRFEYRKSPLLDAIFECKYDFSYFYRPKKFDIWKTLMKIEPAYFFKADQEIIKKFSKEEMYSLLTSALYLYYSRYNLENVSIAREHKINFTIASETNENVKRLIKCINQRR